VFDPIADSLVDIFLPKSEGDAIILGDDRLERPNAAARAGK
jgi:hypothetical protein